MSKQRGRPRKGTLIYKPSGYRARITVEVDGENVRRTVDLGTTNRAAARVKLARLLKSEGPAEQKHATRHETFTEAAGRIVGASGLRTKEARLARIRKHIAPKLGAMPVDRIRAADLQDLLNEAALVGQSRQSVAHLKNDVSAVLGELWREEVLPENVARKVRIPKHAKVDRRERAVLSDSELVAYFGWEHPDEKRRGAVLERQTMVAVSRMFGGLRLGDIKAIRWESLNVEDEEFVSGWAPRQKTARPQLLEVPMMLRPLLRDWWERQGRPAAGFLFPVRKGERTGEQRKQGSPAKALRRDLRRAFGIEAPEHVPFVRANGRADARLGWRKVREPNPRERELLEDGEFTRATDFHSVRRAFKQALADAGLDLQASMALSGASDVKAHQRYLMNTSKMRTVPESAIPILGAARAFIPLLPGDSDRETSVIDADSECRRTDLNRRPRAYEARALTG